MKSYYLFKKNKTNKLHVHFDYFLNIIKKIFVIDIIIHFLNKIHKWILETFKNFKQGF